MNWLNYLYELNVFASRPGLERIQTLWEMLGKPGEKLKFIHVAGTNGKGSVCALLESIYRQAGYRTGLFTSPHLISFGERFQINRIPLSEKKMEVILKKIKPYLEKFKIENHPTFFEVITVIALLAFEEENCDIVLWETGLGGRLDATNIVTPIASIITQITLEHEQYLGSTLSKIAYEKAGIIKNRIPILTAENKEEPLSVIAKIAAEKNAKLYTISEKTDLTCYESGLAGEYQKRNIALAIATVKTLQPILPTKDNNISEGIKKASWEGRFQIIKRGTKTFVLDGAHNVGSFKCLLDSYKRKFSSKPLVIMGVLADKNWSEICKMMADLSQHFITVTVKTKRTLAEEDLAKEIRKHVTEKTLIETKTNLSDALDVVKEKTEEVILICGSLYLIGEALYLLKKSPADKMFEYRLNEWSPNSCSESKN